MAPIAVVAIVVGVGCDALARPNANVEPCVLPEAVAPTRVDGTGNGEIAFATMRNQSSDVYVMQRDGSRQRPVTVNRPPAAAVAWGPDCRFVFADDTGTNTSSIWVASPDTKSLRRLTTGSEPAWSPQGDRIAFTWSNDDDFTDGRTGIYIIRIDATERRQVARTSGDAGRPSWSPDATAIAFTDDEDLRRVDLSTGREQVLGQHGDILPPEVAWSPDGATIAYYGDEDVFSVPATGGTPRVLSATPLDAAYGVAWHPDGRLTYLESAGEGRFAYAAVALHADGTTTRLFTVRASWPPRLAWSRDGAYAVVSSQFGTDVWLVRADGSSRQRVLVGEAHRGPAWSPNGLRLAIATQEQLALLDGNRLATLAGTRCAPPISWAPDGRRLTCNAGSAGSGEIALLRLRTPTRATSRVLLTDRGIGDASKDMADWEPDGHRIVYAESDYAALALHEVGKPPPARGPNARLVPLGGLRAIPVSPDWSPDARRIGFSASCEGVGRSCRAGIYVVRLDGSGLQRITAFGNNPDWNTAGTRLVFDATRNGNRDIYIVDATGRNLRRLTTSRAADYEPSWRTRP